MAFTADYPGALVVEARNYGYVVGGKHLTNNPKAFCLHTPEEPPDNVPSTPYYFASTDRDASTTYFVSYLGFVFQMVPESEGAYGNAVDGKPYPAWADSTVNLNLQTLSVEIEGYAATIHQTMPRGSPQWKALVNLMAHRCKARNIPPGRTFGHYAVSIYRSDPGQLNIPLLVTDVIAAMEEPMTPQEKTEFAALKARVASLEQKPYCIRSVSDPTVYFAAGGVLFSVRDGATWDKLKQLGYCGPDAKTLPDNHILWKLPKVNW